MRTRRLMGGLLIWIVAGALAIYLGCLVTLVVFQRSLVFLPTRIGGLATAYGLPKAKTLALKTVDGQTIVAWYQPPEPGKPLYLYFHGNGGPLSIRGTWLGLLSDDGAGFLAIDYRGYGGSTGTPSERGFILDAEATYAEARKLGYAPDRIVVIGESIGTAVAIALAAERPVKALVLDSAFSSAVALAEQQYWMFPVRFFMLDPFRSIDRIAKVEAPKLFLHGGDDPVIPMPSARRLFDRATPPKTFIQVADAGHMVLRREDALRRMRAWLAALPPEPAPRAAR